MIDSINSSFKIYIYLSKNKIACKCCWFFNWNHLIIIFIIIISISQLNDLHHSSSTPKSKFGFSMKESSDFVAFSLLKICGNRRMVAYLFRYKPEIFSYKLVRLSKHWVKRFFCSHFVSTHWSDIMRNRKCKSV